MYKAILFGTALTVSVTAMVLMAPNSARTAYAYTLAEDSVFMDEGDSGDFGKTPEAAPGPGSLDDLEAAASAPPAAAPAPVEMTNEAPTQMAAPEAAPEAAASTEEAPVAAPKKKAKKEKVAKAPAKKSGTKGKFANTKTDCPLHREPASESETMTTVKSPRKIWVEEVDASWVRAFNKAGEPGYVSTECFE